MARKRAKKTKNKKLSDEGMERKSGFILNCGIVVGREENNSEIHTICIIDLLNSIKRTDLTTQEISILDFLLIASENHPMLHHVKECLQIENLGKINKEINNPRPYGRGIKEVQV